MMNGGDVDHDASGGADAGGAHCQCVNRCGKTLQMAVVTAVKDGRDGDCSVDVVAEE